MDKIADSGSVDMGSTPFGDTKGGTLDKLSPFLCKKTINHPVKVYSFSVLNFQLNPIIFVYQFLKKDHQTLTLQPFSFESIFGF